MDFLIESITPAAGLRIEIIDVAKANAGPEAMFDDSYAALHFALGLGFVGLTDPGSHSQSSHKISKNGVPLGNIVFHFQKDTFHAIGQGRFGQATKVLEGSHHAPDHRGGVTAFDEDDKPHA